MSFRCWENNNCDGDVYIHKDGGNDKEVKLPNSSKDQITLQGLGLGMLVNCSTAIENGYKVFMILS